MTSNLALQCFINQMFKKNVHGNVKSKLLNLQASNFMEVPSILAYHWRADRRLNSTNRVSKSSLADQANTDTGLCGDAELTSAAIRETTRIPLQTDLEPCLHVARRDSWRWRFLEIAGHTPSC